MGIDGRSFWHRVDERLSEKGQNLSSLCELISTSYFTINTQRKKNALPKAEQLYAMSLALDMDMEELLTGRKGVVILPEAKAVQEDPELRLLVRAVMRDRRLLSALAAVVESGERTMGSVSAE